MKARVKVYLNERTGLPSVNAPNENYFMPGQVIDIEEIVNGDDYEGISVWYKVKDAGYVWSGGMEGLRGISIDSEKDLNIPRIVLVNKIIVKDSIPNGNGKGVIVGVLDSGIDLQHETINDNIIETKNFTNEGPLLSDHGTKVAGILAANDHIIKGISTEIGIRNYRIAKKNSVYPKGILKALEELKNHKKVRLINMSLDIPQIIFDKVQDYVNFFYRSGIITIVAGGSSKSGTKISNLKNVIVVKVLDNSSLNLDSNSSYFVNSPIRSTSFFGSTKPHDDFKDSSAYTAVTTGLVSRYLSSPGNRHDLESIKLFIEQNSFSMEANLDPFKLYHK